MAVGSVSPWCVHLNALAWARLCETAFVSESRCRVRQSWALGVPVVSNKTPLPGRPSLRQVGVRLNAQAWAMS